MLCISREKKVKNRVVQLKKITIGVFKGKLKKPPKLFGGFHNFFILKQSFIVLLIDNFYAK